MNTSTENNGLDRLQKIREELNEATKPSKMIDLEEKAVYAFPYSVFPKEIQAVITEWHKAFPVPAEFYAAGILAAFSGAIGNSTKIEYKRGYMEPALLYIALVGPPGLGKTPALSRAVKPLIELEIKYRNEYKEAKRTHAELWNQIREENRFEQKPPPPLCRELIIDDSTTEAVAQLMRQNPKGLTLIKDELMGFIGSMNKYSKGSDAEFWLSTWSNTTAKTNRATKETVFVKSSYVTIVGGIQNSVVKKLATADNVNNGFASRFLFVVPDSFDRKKDTDYEADLEKVNDYQKIINFLFDQLETACGGANRHENYPVSYTIHPGRIRMTNDAKCLFRNWKNEMIEKGNNSSSEWERGSLTKLEAYCLRFCLILELMQVASERKEIKKIGDGEIPYLNVEVQVETVERAIKLCAYFEAMTDRIIDNVSQGKEEAALSSLPKNYLKLYKLLPRDFERSQAIELAEKLSISESSIKRFLKKEHLFSRSGHGKYRREIELTDS